MAETEGVMDFGSGHYKIKGGLHDGYEFHSGDLVDVLYKRRWLPARVEHGSGRYLFLWPIDERDIPDDVIGLPVRLPGR